MCVCVRERERVCVCTYLPPHPDAHGLRSDGRAHSKPLLFPHQLVEQEGLARVELAHHCHHCHCCVYVVQETNVAADDLQVAVVIGVRVDQLHRPLWQLVWEQSSSLQEQYILFFYVGA